VKQSGQKLTISQAQAACLIANCFLCTFPPRRNVDRSGQRSHFPVLINFAGLYTLGLSPAVRHAKLACLINYLTRVAKTPPTGQLAFERRVVYHPPAWNTSTTRVDGRALRVVQRTKIEDVGGGVVQVDFANKTVGGGVVTDDSAAQVTAAFSDKWYKETFGLT